MDKLCFSLYAYRAQVEKEEEGEGRKRSKDKDEMELYVLSLSSLSARPPRSSVGSLRASGLSKGCQSFSECAFRLVFSCFPVPISVKNFEKTKQTLLVLYLM